jgi:GntR family transcriptional regulator, galactonate operon transcriptional repressor
MRGKANRASRAPVPRRSDWRRKADGVLDRIGQQIVSGQVASGDRLPTEMELAHQLGISRPSLREALNALARKGLVEARARRGTTALGKERWDVLDPDVLRWMASAPPDPEFLIVLLEARTIFEPAAARLAAQRASAAQIVEIERAYRDMVAALPDDVEACCRHDLALHEGIIAASGNVLLIRLAATIRTALLALIKISSDARESYENSLAEHGAVVAAIRQRAPDEAERAMRRLLAGTARDLAPAIEPRPGRSAGKKRPAAPAPRTRSRRAGMRPHHDPH